MWVECKNTRTGSNENEMRRTGSNVIAHDYNPQLHAIAHNLACVFLVSTTTSKGKKKPTEKWTAKTWSIKNSSSRKSAIWKIIPMKMEKYIHESKPKKDREGRHIIFILEICAMRWACIEPWAEHRQSQYFGSVLFLSHHSKLDWIYKTNMTNMKW